jgi:peroxiredoxin
MHKINRVISRIIAHRLPAMVGIVACLALCTAIDMTRAAEGQRAAPAAGHIGPFSLRDTQGAQHSAGQWRASEAIVLFFIGTECPVSNGYAPDMQRIATKYGRRGVACYGVHSDPLTTAEQVAKHATEYGLTFPILLDPAQTLARAARVRVTPEAVVVTPGGDVLYRGRIDDRYTPDGKRRDVARVVDLENALDSVLAGGKPKESETKAFGCPLPKLKQEGAN